MDWTRHLTRGLLVAGLLAGGGGGAAQAGGPAGERIVIHVDATPTDYCMYDGRPYSEGAVIDAAGTRLVCSYRERDAATGEGYLPAEENRRLKWLAAGEGDDR